ncbi:hypothetical protein P9112_003322 [Eukaryota sp. TZLM1-RC]
MHRSRVPQQNHHRPHLSVPRSTSARDVAKSQSSYVPMQSLSAEPSPDDHKHSNSGSNIRSWTAPSQKKTKPVNISSLSLEPSTTSWADIKESEFTLEPSLDSMMTTASTSTPVYPKPQPVKRHPSAPVIQPPTVVRRPKQPSPPSPLPKVEVAAPTPPPTGPTDGPSLEELQRYHDDMVELARKKQEEKEREEKRIEEEKRKRLEEKIRLLDEKKSREVKSKAVGAERSVEDKTEEHHTTSVLFSPVQSNLISIKKESRRDQVDDVVKARRVLYEDDVPQNKETPKVKKVLRTVSGRKFKRKT